MRITITVAFVGLFIFSACNRFEYQSEYSGIEVFGHAGMGISFHQPIDSQPSLEKAIEVGAEGLEIDVRMSGDGSLVAYHHDDLDGLTKCNGEVFSQSDAELRDCEYKTVYFGNADLVFLSDFVQDHVVGENIKLSLDVKLDAGGQAYLGMFADALHSLVSENGLEGRVTIESSNIQLLEMLQARNQALGLFIYSGAIESDLQKLKEQGFQGLSVAFDKITTDQVQKVKNAGFEVILWNTQSRADHIEAIEKRPDYIQTDKLKQLLRMLKKD